METRDIKGLEIATTLKITRQGLDWIVPSQSSSNRYKVKLDAGTSSCTCPDYEAHRQKCKHIFAVEHALRRESGEALPAVPKHTRPTYPQAWHEYNLSQTREGALLPSLLYELCQGIDEPVQRFGRPRALLSDIIFAACLKVYGGMSGRRNQSDVRDALRRGYLLQGVHYNTISKYLERETLTPYLQDLITQSSLPLKSVERDLAIDSTGFRTKGHIRWFSHKYGREIEKADWVKVHVVCGVETNIVIAALTSNHKEHDSPFFKTLLDIAAQSGFNLREVVADKGYDSYENRRRVLLKGAIPYIPFRSSASPEGKGALWQRMYHFFSLHQEEFYQHYHKRSNVETVFSMMKLKFGEKLRSRTETAQINEALCKVLCHNLCCLIQAMYELKIDVSLWSKAVVDHKVVPIDHKRLSF
jgi:transposase